MVVRLDALPKQILGTAVLGLVFLLASAGALRPWVAQYAGRGSPHDQAARRGLSIDPGNGHFQAILATFYHYSLLLRDYSTALTYYHAALRTNPLDSASWLHLGKLYQRLDRPREADRALRLALHVARSESAILWEATLAYLEAGQIVEALQALSLFISVSRDGSDQARGYDLARRLLSPQEVLDRIIPANATQQAQYLKYLLDRSMGDEAHRVWGRLRGLPPGADEPIKTNLLLGLIDLLLAQGKPGPAHEVWSHAMKRMRQGLASDGSNLVSNGGFESRETLGRGFDWRIDGAPGIRADLDHSVAYAGRQSLMISFEKAPADLSRVSQVIRVQPDSTYAFEAYVKTSGLSGSDGIGLEILDPHKGLLARTEAVSGTRDWTRAVATFRTVEKSRFVTLRLRGAAGPPSTLYSRTTAWIDDVSVTKAR